MLNNYILPATFDYEFFCESIRRLLDSSLNQIVLKGLELLYNHWDSFPEKQLDDVSEQLQQAKKLVEEHEQKTYSLKKQCDEVKAKLSSVILDPKTCKRENKSSSNTAFAEDEISFLRAAQEKADGYNGYRHDMSNAKSYEFISTECDLAKVDKQVQDLRELVNEKKMKLKECRERCKNRHQPWPP